MVNTEDNINKRIKKENSEKANVGEISQSKAESKSASSKSEKEDEMNTKLRIKVSGIKDRILNSKNVLELKLAIDDLKDEIIKAKKSMTDIPKPIKFVLPFFKEISDFFDNFEAKQDISLLADILSCISMIIDEEEENLCLGYKLKSSDDNVELWGEEYVRHLSREILKVFNSLENGFGAGDRRLRLIENIVKYYIKNSTESEAIDLLIEVDQLNLITAHLDKPTALKTSAYLLSCQQYIPLDLPQSFVLLKAAFDLYVQHGCPIEAFRAALLSDRTDLMRVAYESCTDELQRKQIANLTGLSRSNSALLEDDEELAAIAGNESLNKHFEWLAEQLNMTSVKQLEDIYKTNLIDRSTFKKYGSSREEDKSADSARESLASTFTNAFVHAGFGEDALVSPENSEWVFKNRDLGKASAAASIGLIHLWGLEKGFTAADRLMESSDEMVKAGALLAFGIIGSGVTSELDASSALLLDHLEGESDLLKLFAVIGTGISSVNTSNAESAEPLDPLVLDFTKPEICAFSCLSLGLIHVGSCHEKAGDDIFEALMYFSFSEISSDLFMCICSGLGLLYLGSRERSDGILKAIEVLDERKYRIAKTAILAFAYAGSGNVIKYRKILKRIQPKLNEQNIGEKADSEKQKSESKKDTKSDAPTDKNNGKPENNNNATQSKEKKNDKQKSPAENNKQNDSDNKDPRDEKNEKKNEKKKNDEDEEAALGLSVIGLAVIAMGEKLGKNMCYKIFDDILRYESIKVRRAVPLGLALLFASKPDYSVVGLLGKLSHDPDEELCINAILALGIVSAGTNNSRVAKMLRNLAVYYQKDDDQLFVTRIAQGLVHSGKGLMTLNPYLQDGRVLNKNAISGLLVLLISCIHAKKNILGKRHFILYYLSLALRPRMLITVDEKMEPLEVSVRVGQAVDNVRLAGEDKSITGFQTHQTPVLLSVGEKAELATKKYLPVTSELDGIVILKPNPDYTAPEAQAANA